MILTDWLRRLLYTVCLLACALPLGAVQDEEQAAQAREARREGMREQTEEGQTCNPPVFAVKGWEDAETLILHATADPVRTFRVRVGLTKVPKKQRARAMMAPPRAEAEGAPPAEARNLPQAEALKTSEQTCLDGADDSYDYIFCKEISVSPSEMKDGKAEPHTQIVVPINEETFSRLLGKDGEIHIHYQNVGMCDVQGWQHNLTAFERSVVKMEAGPAYSRDGAGDWKAKGEAALRFNTRWRPRLSGAIEFRYTGLENSEDDMMDSDDGGDGGGDDGGAKVEEPAGSEEGEQEFNPFTATDGILRGDFYLGYHLGDRGILPSLSNSVVAGFGLSTFRGASDSMSDLSDTRRRLFVGYRLSVPRYHVEGIEDIISPRGYIQFNVAHDEVWKFTVPAAEGSTEPPRKVDEPYRFVAEGIFEFFQIGTDNNRIPVKVRIFWDSPLDFKGESDVRISVLGAINLFRH